MELAVVLKRFVVVAFPSVPVPRVKFVLNKLVLVAELENRFVELAVVENSAVVVALPSVTVPAFRLVL